MAHRPWRVLAREWMCSALWLANPQLYLLCDRLPRGGTYFCNANAIGALPGARSTSGTQLFNGCKRAFAPPDPAGADPHLPAVSLQP